MADIARLASVLLGGTAGVLGSVDQSNKQNENRRLKEVMLADKQASAQKKAASTAKLQQVLEGMLSQGSIGQGQFDLTSALTDLDPEAGAAMASKFGSGNVEAEMKAHAADEEQSLDPRLGPEPEPGVTLQNQIRGMNVTRSGIKPESEKEDRVSGYGETAIYDRATGKKKRSYKTPVAPREPKSGGAKFSYPIIEKGGYRWKIKQDNETGARVKTFKPQRMGKIKKGFDPFADAEAETPEQTSEVFVDDEQPEEESSPAPAATTGKKFSSPEAVKKALAEKKISAVEATKILKSDFGFD